MLNGKLGLHDVQDAEAFAVAAIHRAASKESMGWPEWKREELLADAVSHLWELSIRYDPDIGTFRGYANQRLVWFVVDWIRKREGRTRFKFGPDAQHIRVEFRQGGGLYERPRRETLSLDAHVHTGEESRQGGATERFELGELVASRDLDPHELAGSLDLRGALARGAGPKARAAAAEDFEDAGGSEGRTRAA